MINATSSYSAKAIDELPTLWDGFAKLVRAGLDITAFGANIMDLPPDYATTSHDEAESGRRNCTSRWSARGQSASPTPSSPGSRPFGSSRPGMARVLSSGPEGLRVLCIGGVPGRAYEPQEWSSTGD